MHKVELEKCTIGCIVVTFNRLGKLKKTLKYYALQSLLPLYVIVVNNASTDGTEEFLEEWKKQNEGFLKIVINSETNLGGSGGFYLGEEAALNQNADWIMIADDDAYPESNYLEGMQKYINSHKKDEISVVCGKVIEQDNFVNTHRARWRTKWDCNLDTAVDASNYQKEEFYPDFVSYVGAVINKEKMEKVGPVNKDYFIYCDDFEHTYRLNQVGKMVCIPKYNIIHDTDRMSKKNRVSWKTYYGYRNSLKFLKTYFPAHYFFVLGKLFFKSMLAPLKGRSSDEVKIRFAAMRDSLFNHMGKNEVYKPGWKP